MFANAIDRVSAFTRPIHTIVRTYGGRKIVPGSATLFFVNEEGVAVTCRHVVEQLIHADKINQTYAHFKAERDRLQRDGKYKKHLQGLELKYNYKPDTVIQVKNNFRDCVDTMSGFTTHIHAKHDLAILQFNDFNRTHYTGHAVFLRDASRVRTGDMLCRLGFPFPEFSNFAYDEPADDIVWTNEGVSGSPRFPIEGMVTRFLAESPTELYGIELSTPGLRGQSGGPLFDSSGIVYGMQFSTKHLHLGFDLEDKEVMVNNNIKKVSNYSFIHLGQCIHAEVIKAFLREKGIRYYEE